VFVNNASLGVCEDPPVGRLPRRHGRDRRPHGA
jgi:hypothetical protein